MLESFNKEGLMGLFNSVIVKCPQCGEENDEQFKPGYMDRYDFPEDVDSTPVDYLKEMNDHYWSCYKCNTEFRTFVDVAVTISNARVELEKE